MGWVFEVFLIMMRGSPLSLSNMNLNLNFVGLHNCMLLLKSKLVAKKQTMYLFQIGQVKLIIHRSDKSIILKVKTIKHANQFILSRNWFSNGS